MKGEWKNDGLCVEGKQKLTRTIVNEDLCENDGDVDGTKTEKTVDCCGVTDWEIDKTAFGADENQNYCKPNGKRTETRTLYNRNLCEQEGKSFMLTQPLSQEVDCCYVPKTTTPIYEDGQRYAIDDMYWFKWWKSQIENDSTFKYTVEDWDKYKEENTKPCNADGEVRVKRNVANPELCKAEVAAGIREEDPNSFKSEYVEKCCTFYGGEPKAGTYCNWTGSDGIGEIEMVSKMKNLDICIQDAYKMKDKFLEAWPRIKYNYSEKWPEWDKAKEHGTAIYPWTTSWPQASHVYDGKVAKRACYSNGTVELSDINWGEYGLKDAPGVTKSSQCGYSHGRCPGTQCCSSAGWCAGTIGTYSDWCHNWDSEKGWSGGKYDGLHWNAPRDTDWSITK